MSWTSSARQLTGTSGVRLAALLAGAFLAVTLALIAIAQHVLDSVFESHVVEMIRKDVDGQDIATRLGSAGGLIAVLRQRDSFDPRPERRSMVVDGQGRVLLGDPALYAALAPLLPACAAPPCPSEPVEVKGNGSRIVAMRLGLADGGQYLAAYDVAPMVGRLRPIPIAAGIGLMTVLMLAAWTGLRFGMVSLGRVDAIRAVLERYGAGQRDARVADGGGHDEFSQLAGLINHTLDRLTLLVDEVRSTSGHIAHELRTPLTRLQTRLVTLAESAPASMRDEVLLAVGEVTHVQSLARAIMRVGEIESGRCAHHFNPVAVADLLADLAEYYQPLAEERGCAITVDIAPDCPLSGDRDLLFQALANLVDNALKYGRPGGPIRLSAWSADGWVDLGVTDYGPGIVADLRPVALERFRRLDNSAGQPGDGLGLPLVKAIAELHRGQVILADADPGPGLAATLRLPAGGTPHTPR